MIIGPVEQLVKHPLKFEKYAIHEIITNGAKFISEANSIIALARATMCAVNIENKYMEQKQIITIKIKIINGVKSVSMF